jgi:hypothetical protein
MSIFYHACFGTSQPAILEQWMSAFDFDTNDTSDGSIDAADLSQLLVMTLPDTVTVGDAEEFISRWNRSVSYADKGITTASRVPAGQSTDFLDQEALLDLFGAAENAVLSSQADGYADPVTEFRAAVNQFIATANDTSVCCTVELEIDQTVALTRTAFTGTLTLANQLSGGPLQDIDLQLDVTDADGNPVNGLFYISSPTFSGALTAVDGTGSLPADSSGSVTYTFIPSEDAAQTTPTIYYIGGTLE